jgi:hypothetical protein
MQEAEHFQDLCSDFVMPKNELLEICRSKISMHNEKAGDAAYLVFSWLKLRQYGGNCHCTFNRAKKNVSSKQGKLQQRNLSAACNPNSGMGAIKPPQTSRLHSSLSHLFGYCFFSVRCLSKTTSRLEC